MRSPIPALFLQKICWWEIPSLNPALFSRIILWIRDFLFSWDQQRNMLDHQDENSYALSFYGSKMVLDSPNHFGPVPIILAGSNLFWSVPNHFGQVQTIKISPEKSNLNLTKMIWTQPKWFVPVQNNLDDPKSVWSYRRTRHKH